MKQILLMSAMVMLSMCAVADVWTDPQTKIEWHYVLSNGEACVGEGPDVPAVTNNGSYAIEIPASILGYPVTAIGERAFFKHNKLTEVIIPQSVKTFNFQCFHGCDSLCAMEIPIAVTNIGGCAFSGCGIGTIEISKNVRNIGSSAFEGCKKLTAINVDGENECYASVDGVLYDKSLQTILVCPGAKTSIMVNEETTSIEDSAFRGGMIENVVLPKCLKSVAFRAFSYCGYLKNVTIKGDGVQFGYSVFYGSDSVQYDFEGLPASGLSNASIKKDAVIRYNVAYEKEWKDVIAQCGFTNASSYEPEDSKLEDGGPYVEARSGVVWTFMVTNLESIIKGIDDVSGSVTIPSTLGERPVTAIDHAALMDCRDVTSVTIPTSVKEIGSEAFSGCEKLADVWFEGNTIMKIGNDAFRGCCWDLIMHVPADWQGRGRTIAGYTMWRGGSSDIEKCVNMTITNVVVQYVLNSIQPEIAVPVSNSVGFVNIITEVASSGAVSVPTEWKDNYPQFEAKFGSDLGKALAMKTGKKDGAGNDMFVWQDFVAGTDPTDEDDVFSASITIVDGVPVISYTPELTAEQAALRVYKTYGKMKLTDTEWTDITAKTNEECSDYNFFKVTVEMK